MKLKRKHVNLIGLISAVIFLISLLYNQFVPELYRWSAFILGALFIVVLVFKKLPKVLIIVLSVLLILTSTLLFYTQYSAERILDYFEKEVNVVSFVVLKTSPIKTMEDANGKFFGTLKTMDSDLVSHIVDEVKSKHKYSINTLAYVENEDAINALDNGNIEVLILDDSILEFLIDSNPEFVSRIRVIYTISKEIFKEDITKVVEVDKDSFVILVSGIDIFGSINRRSRSDVNMLLVVNPKTGKILMVSLPRDTFVPLACKNDALDKLTHSGIYGINCTVQTVENFLEIDVNYYMRLNFTSFINIVDSMGGVNIYNETEFISYPDGVHFKQGKLSLDGTEAYNYVRERRAYEGGDAHRIQNQQKVLIAIIKKILSPSIFTKIENIVSIAAENVDTNITSTEISKLIKLQLNKGIDWEFSSAFITGTDAYRPTYSIGNMNLYVVLPDQSSVIAVQEAIKSVMDEK